MCVIMDSHMAIEKRKEQTRTHTTTSRPSWARKFRQFATGPGTRETGARRSRPYSMSGFYEQAGRRVFSNSPHTPVHKSGTEGTSMDFTRVIITDDNTHRPGTNIAPGLEKSEGRFSPRTARFDAKRTLKMMPQDGSTIRNSARQSKRAVTATRNLKQGGPQ